MKGRARAAGGDDTGAALVIVMTASLLLAVLGGSIALATATEATIASSYRDGIALVYAAEAGAGIAMARLETAPSWAGLPLPYLAGRLDDLMGVERSAAPYIVSVSLVDPGVRDRLVVVSQASGRAMQRTVRVTVARVVDAGGGTSLRVLAWEELR